MISCSDGTRPTAPFLCASSTQDLSQVFNQVWNLHKDNDKDKDKDKHKGPFQPGWNLHKDNDKDNDKDTGPIAGLQPGWNLHKDNDKDIGPIAGLQPGWNVVSISIMVKIVYDDHHENYYSVFNLVYSRFEIDIEGATPKVKVSIFSNPRSL